MWISSGDKSETDTAACKGTLIGSALGFFVGILPAAGATPGSLMPCGVARMTSRDPESYGKGDLDGVAAPEAANNSASTGAMLPLLKIIWSRVKSARADQPA